MDTITGFDWKGFCLDLFEVGHEQVRPRTA
jgi:hypothetical protein